ncbi:MAG: ROK family protein [Polyangiaceae bacterium]
MTAVIGVDLGGTKTEVVVARWLGDRLLELERSRVATPRDEGYDAIIESTAAHVERCARRAGVSLDAVKIGVGMPGGVERRTGFVKNSNTTCLNNRPFRQDLARRLGYAIRFENDANCFALAEVVLGAFRELERGVVFGVILGTGVGGAVVIDRRVWSGLHGIAGEWGHHAVYNREPRRASTDPNLESERCYCGKVGCLETFASGPALERRYRELTGRSRSLAEIDAAADNDEAAALVMSELVDAFGRGLANVIDVLDPSGVVLGGGLSNLERLYSEGRARVAKYLFNDELLTPIVKNALGDSSGVLGAALVALADDT